MDWKHTRQKLKDSLMSVQQLTAQFAKSTPTKINPQILQYATSSKASERQGAATALVYIAMQSGEQEALDLLTQFLNDADDDVRGLAVGTLGAWGYGPAIPGLIGLLKSANPSQRKAAGYSLCAIGEDAVPQLVQVLANDDEPEAQREAATALYSMGSDVVGWLLNIFEDKHSKDWISTLPILAKYADDFNSKILDFTALHLDDTVVSGRAMQATIAIQEFLDSPHEP